MNISNGFTGKISSLNGKGKPKNVFSWMNPKLKVLFISKYGKRARGVFAAKALKKGEILAIFGGYIMTLKEEECLPKVFRDHGVQISEDFVLTVREKKEVEDAGYFNHSCNPNAGYRGQIFLEAMRDMKKNEEVTFDYAMVLCGSVNAKKYIMKCNCGANNCRKIISEDDWKKKEIQVKYNGYFQYYLQEKINKLINKL